MKIEEIFAAVKEGDLIVFSYLHVDYNEEVTEKMKVLFKSEDLIGISKYISAYREKEEASQIRLRTMSTAGITNQFEFKKELTLASTFSYYSNCSFSIEKAD